MSAITDTADGMGVRNGHSQCLLCGTLNPRSPGLAFQLLPNREVRASFQAQPKLQSYGIQGATGDLQVHYVRSIACDAALEIRARLLHARPPLYRLKAELYRDEQILAWAKTTFMQRRRP